MLMLGSETIDLRSVVIKEESTPSRAPAVRTPTLLNLSSAPERSESSCSSSWSRRATWLPTTPQPSIPIVIVLTPEFIAPFFHR